MLDPYKPSHNRGERSKKRKKTKENHVETDNIHKTKAKANEVKGDKHRNERSGELSKHDIEIELSKLVVQDLMGKTIQLMQ